MIDLKLPKLDPLDKRLNAWRDDLADIRLQGKVNAQRFVEGDAAVISTPIADMKFSCDPSARTEHQLLMGCPVSIFERPTVDGKDWAWIQSRVDDYVGYVPVACLENPPAGNANLLRVMAPATFAYSKPDLKDVPNYRLSMGSIVEAVDETEMRGTRYKILTDESAVVASHLARPDDHQQDYVSVCEQLINVPYLWGADSSFGLDCSGLVQLAMAMCGRNILRDSDMQAATVGKVLDIGEDIDQLRRGDLIFWRGHVAVCQGKIDGQTCIIHANGHTMNVASEGLEDAIERIAYLYERPVGYRRP